MLDQKTQNETFGHFLRFLLQSEEGAQLAINELRRWAAAISNGLGPLEKALMRDETSEEGAALLLREHMLADRTFRWIEVIEDEVILHDYNVDREALVVAKGWVARYAEDIDTNLRRRLNP